MPEPKEEIRQRIDIADLISEYLTTKPAGSGSFKALCPFHNEKSPSFYISRDKQIWHCFGCDKGGDIFSFVMEMDGMDFPTALQFLGKKAGVKVDSKPQKGQGEYDKLREIHALSTVFYQTVLHKHALGEKSREYLKTRGFEIDLVKKFELGSAPDNWDTLTVYLKKKGITDELLLKAGLSKRSSSGNLIDRFRNRLLIPLRDPQGRVVGYTGRLLVEQGEKTGPKYLNSPETPIYKKSDILFGFAFAKRSMRQLDAAIVVEGNLDVVASHKAGVANVVASCGTALTEGQLLLIKKQTNKLLMCFDSDNAGFAAAQRGIQLAQKLGFDVDVISIPEDIGKDPDDVVRNNPEEWKKLVAKPIPVMKYYIDRWSKEVDPTNPRSKRDFAKRVLDEVVYVKDMVERQHWLQIVADMTQTDVELLKTSVGATKKPDVVTIKPSEKPKKPTKLTRQQKSYRFIIGSILQDEALLVDLKDKLKPEDIKDPLWSEVYKSIQLSYTEDVDPNSTQTPIFQRLRSHWQNNEKVEYLKALDAALVHAEAMTTDMTAKDLRNEVDRHIAFIKTRALKARKLQLAAQIRQAEQAGQSDRVRELLQEYNAFTITSTG